MAEREVSRTALVAGVLFIGAGLAFLLEGLDVWDIGLDMMLPAALIALGLAVLLGGRFGVGR